MIVSLEKLSWNHIANGLFAVLLAAGGYFMTTIARVQQEHASAINSHARDLTEIRTIQAQRSHDFVRLYAYVEEDRRSTQKIEARIAELQSQLVAQLSEIKVMIEKRLPREGGK